MSIKSTTIQNGTIAIIDIKGSLIGDDLTEGFRREVSDYLEQGNKSLIINLQRLNYMNSSGLGALIAAHTSYAKNGGEIRLVGVTKNVQNLLVVTRLIEIFDVYDKIEEAIKSFSEKKSKK